MKKLIFAAVVLLAACAPMGEWTSMMPDAELTNWRVVGTKADEGTGPEQIVIGADKVMLYGPADVALPLPEFVDFELAAQVMVSPDAASSLWFHHGETYGYEIVLGPTRMDASKQTTGSLNDVENIFETPAVPDRWFELRVAVKGKRITVRIDGKRVVDYTEPENVRRARDDMQRLGKGTFVLDSYRGTTTVRDMKMRNR